MALVTSQGHQLVSVVILNYNAASFLSDCINSVLNSTYSNIEIIFVDNASTDDSVNFTRRNYGHLKNLKIIVNEQNFGFNEGNNIGFTYSKGDFCLFMNPDTKINDPTTIEKLVQVLIARNDAGIIAPVLLDYKSDFVQSAGVYQSFRAFEYGKGECYEIFLNKNPVAYPVAVAPGAFVIVKRKLIDEIGLFDKVFFMQGDIDDLSLRAWKKGYKVLILPTVTVRHYEGGSVKQSFTSVHQRLLRIYYHGIRADFAVTTKNFDFANIVKFVSIRLMIYFVETFLVSVKYGNAYPLLAYFKAIGWNLKQFKYTYLKRKIIREGFFRQDSLYMPYILGNCTFSDYLKRLRQFRS